MKLGRSAALLGCVFLASCGGDSGSSSGGGIGVVPGPKPTPTPTPTPTPSPGGGPTKVVEFSFANDNAGFTASDADFTSGQETSIAFTAREEQLPNPMASQTGFALSGTNASNDLFMYIWKPVTGLSPNTRYKLDLSITFATNAPPSCTGSPGENVWIKAGATSVQPTSTTQNGRVTVNFDKGNQGTGGADVVLLGTFAQSTAGGDCNAPVYETKTLGTGGNGPTVTSDASGQVWLVIGTDSGYSGTTKIYYLSGQASLSPVGS